MIILQEFPTARQFSGMDLVTTLPVPITLPFPIVTPARIMLPPPIHTLFSTVIGKVFVLKNNLPEFSSQSLTKLSQKIIG